MADVKWSTRLPCQWQCSIATS